MERPLKSAALCAAFCCLVTLSAGPVLHVCYAGTLGFEGSVHAANLLPLQWQKFSGYLKDFPYVPACALWRMLANSVMWFLVLTSVAPLTLILVCCVPWPFCFIPDLAWTQSASTHCLPNYEFHLLPWYCVWMSAVTVGDCVGGSNLTVLPFQHNHLVLQFLHLVHPF